jgi:transposase
MLFKTILNRVQKFKSFLYQQVRWTEGGGALEIEVAERANARPACAGCGKLRPGYDRLAPRHFEFVPLWGLKVFLVYAPRRVQCPACGVRVEAMPWALGKRPLTQAYGWFLAGWAKRLCWKEVAQVFHASWDSVFRSVEMAVEWGRAHQNLSAITSIGIDEIKWQRGHRYLTLV